MKALIDKLYEKNKLSRKELNTLLENINYEETDYLLKKARMLTDQIFGRDIYIRGLIEFTNYCFRNCKYCGIRKDNTRVQRYRLSEEEILDICKHSYKLGFRTFVLQGGEDYYYYDIRIIDLVRKIRSEFNDCAITLSIGEREKEIYRRLIDVGANRFLLRHETIHEEQYEKFHPDMDFEERINCIKTLKELRYQTGTGFLIGLPNQKMTDYVDDLLFIKELNPEMVGIGPFIPHQDTPLGKCNKGSVRITLIMLAIIRLLLPNVMLPSSTALNTLLEGSFFSGFNAGANVLMLNITTKEARENYNLYEGKEYVDINSDQTFEILREKLGTNGYILNLGRGDYKGLTKPYIPL